jgi:hypothetical protein
MGRLKVITHRYLSLSLYGHYVEVVFKSEFSNTQFHHLQCQTQTLQCSHALTVFPRRASECVAMSQRRVQNTLNPLLIEKKTPCNDSYGYCVSSRRLHLKDREEWRNRLLIEQDTLPVRARTVRGTIFPCVVTSDSTLLILARWCAPIASLCLACTAAYYSE